MGAAVCRASSNTKDLRAGSAVPFWESATSIHREFAYLHGEPDQHAATHSATTTPTMPCRGTRASNCSLSMRRLGKEAYLFNYNGEPHHLNRRPNQKDYTVRMQQFFDHLLKDAAKPDWMEKGISYNDREQEKEKFITIYSEDPEARKDLKK
jgi:hypothetical protein